MRNWYWTKLREAKARARLTRMRLTTQESKIMKREKGGQAIMSKKETREKASRIKEPNEKRRSLKVAPLERNEKFRLARVQRQIAVSRMEGRMRRKKITMAMIMRTV
ncbi:uncharacterized protein LOC112212314 [Bombus impatiens]|uniref:Uncharacterized protein LOC112212314 n=1 Tax=Bombus impatiens TaxID=132113 RepID=A0A6P8KWZ0_BOMIM|nr:uncharacterized protein LOC112212314 [Bombus impatiens]